MTTKTQPLSKIATPILKGYAMEAAKGKAPPDVDYTKVVRILASRLRSNPKKVRRQARTQFWAS